MIDSIVRQSRHQFGPDKDVFAPRFAKNIQVGINVDVQYEQVLRYQTFNIKAYFEKKPSYSTVSSLTFKSEHRTKSKPQFNYSRAKLVHQLHLFSDPFTSFGTFQACVRNYLLIALAVLI